MGECGWVFLRVRVHVVCFDCCFIVCDLISIFFSFPSYLFISSFIFYVGVRLVVVLVLGFVAAHSIRLAVRMDAAHFFSRGRSSGLSAAASRCRR